MLISFKTNYQTENISFVTYKKQNANDIQYTILKKIFRTLTTNF